MYLRSCPPRPCALRLALLVMPLACAAASPPELHGTIEVAWGDPAPDSGRSAAFEVEFVGEHGERLMLDADAATKAAGGLDRLIGRSVAMTLQPGPWIDGRAVPASIVDRTPTDSIATPAVAGNLPWVNIACKFSDIATEPRTLAYIDGGMANQSGRLDHYWREVSYNKIDIAGSASYGWFTLPHPRSFYEPFDSAQRSVLINDCTAVADATVNFAPFTGINTLYNASLDGNAWGNAAKTLTLDGTTRTWRATWLPPFGYADAAPWAHEMGHGFGLPHANNSDGDTDAYDNPWDVMSDLWHNLTTDATYGRLPKHINTWSRDRLGWVDAARKLTLSVDGTYNNLVLDRASLIGSANTQMIVIVLPPPAPATHYYIVEARKRTGTYDGNLAGNAVIVHEVDTTRSQPSWSMDAAIPPADRANNPESMFVVGESWVDPSGAFQVSVVGETAEGFAVNVQRGGDLRPDLIFRNGFQ